jgi:hypothetical protein
MRKVSIVFFFICIQVNCFSQKNGTKISYNSLDSFVLGSPKSNYSYLKKFINIPLVVGKDTIISDVPYTYSLYEDYRLPYPIDTFNFKNFLIEFNEKSTLASFYLNSFYDTEKNADALEKADADIIKLKKYFENQIGKKGKYKKMIHAGSYIMYGYLWKIKSNTISISIQYDFKYNKIITFLVSFTTLKVNYF